METCAYYYEFQLGFGVIFFLYKTTEKRNPMRIEILCWIQICKCLKLIENVKK